VTGREWETKRNPFEPGSSPEGKKGSKREKKKFAKVSRTKGGGGWFLGKVIDRSNKYSPGRRGEAVTERGVNAVKLRPENEIS